MATERRELEQHQQGSDAVLRQAVVVEYKTKPHTPELITTTWQGIWKIWGERAGLAVVVPALAFTQGEIERHEQENDPVFYVPPEVTLPILGKMFPEMRSYSVQKDSPVTVDSRHIGWRSGQASIDAPNSNTREKDLKDLFAKQGREGMDLREYIILSQSTELLIGRYLDESTTWSRLLGSRREDQVVGAYFNPNGALSVHRRLRPDDRYPSWGGRSSAGVKRA